MRNLKAAITLATSAIGVFASSAHATDWLQFGYDQAHSGFNTAEHGFSTSGNFTLFHYTLPTTVNSAPVYLGNVVTTQGTKNLLFVLAQNGNVYAIDADAITNTSDANIIWMYTSSGAGSQTAGSPVVDPSLNFVYTYSNDGNVRKFNVGKDPGNVPNPIDGRQVLDANWPELASSKPNWEKSAASLSIASPAGGVNYLYSVMDGYPGDGNDYQGHVTAINLSTGSQIVFNTLCSSKGNTHFDSKGSTSSTDCNTTQSGIWGRPGTVFDANSNKIFIATGNFHTTLDGNNWGESVLALPAAMSAELTAPLDSYTPSEWASMGDADLGSSSPALLPDAAGNHPHLLVQIGKDSQVRLLDRDNLSNGASGSPPSGGELQKFALPQGNVVIQQPAVWVNPADGSTWVYIVNASGAAAYQLVVTSGQPALVHKWPTSGNGHSGSSPVVANGVLYYISGSHVIALDAVTGGGSTNATIWQSAAMGGNKWQSLILVNSRIYAIDNTSQLWAFELDGVFHSTFDANGS